MKPKRGRPFKFPPLAEREVGDISFVDAEHFEHAAKTAATLKRKRGWQFEVSDACFGGKSYKRVA